LRPGAVRPGVRIVLLMPTLEQAKKVHATLMLAELESDWACLGGKVDRTQWRVTFPGGSWIQWVTAERAKNIRGLRCDVVCVDEADDIDPEILDAIVVPWFSEPHSLRIVLVGGTPTRGRYGLLYRTHARGRDNAFPDHHTFHASCYDFPAYVDPKAIEKARRETPEALFKREWLCDFDAAEGLVYSLFDEAFHVREPHRDAAWNEYLIGVDHGYEDPGVMLVAGVAGGGRDATVHLLSEVYEQHKTESWWLDQAAVLHRAHPGARWYADPSRPDRIEAMRRLGLRIESAQNAIEGGVGSVADKLVKRPSGPTGEPWSRLYVSPGCINTIREFGLYRRKRDPRNRERILDDIEDKNNHAMDALRYLIFSRFGAAASSVSSFDGGADFGWG